MNKEKLSINFVKKQYGETIFSALYASDEIKRDKFFFLAGYNTAEQQQDEFTISFAIWYAKHKIEARLGNVPMSDKELLEFYRESINK